VSAGDGEKPILNGGKEIVETKNSYNMFNRPGGTARNREKDDSLRQGIARSKTS